MTDDARKLADDLLLAAARFVRSANWNHGLNPWCDGHLATAAMLTTAANAVMGFPPQ